MMNFEERRAEIFRRSDERIKERKRNRQRIVMSCIPVVICAGILTVSYAQNYYSRQKDSLPETWGISTNNYSLVYPVTVELIDLDSGETRNIEGCDRIIPVTDIIFFITEVSDRLPLDNYGIHTESTDSDQHKGIGNTGFYEITITRENETGVDKIDVFTLNGNVLTDKDTQQEYLLTETELEELLTALDLTD